MLIKVSLNMTILSEMGSRELIVEERIKILLTGEDKTQLWDLREILSLCEYDVEIASDGDGVIALSSQFEPDLIILNFDADHRKADGYYTCKMLRSLYICPIVAITENGDEAEKLKYMSWSLDRVIEKPNSAEMLLAEIHSSLRLWLVFKRSLE